MSHDDRELANFESTLADLSPSRSRIDRAELLFRAGQESAIASRQRSSLASWCWPLSTVAMAISATGLAWQVFQQGEPVIVERVQIVERAVPAEAKLPDGAASATAYEIPGTSDVEYFVTAPLDSNHYLQQRELALNVGVDALAGSTPLQTPAALERASYREMRTSLGHELEPTQSNNEKSES